MAQALFCFTVKKLSGSNILFCRGNEFLCYKSLKETNPHGRLIVTNATCAIGPKDLEFRIEIPETKQQDMSPVTPTTTITTKLTTTNNEEEQDKIRVWKLKASSKEELDEWCQTIQKAILYSSSSLANADLMSPPPLITTEAPATGLDAEIQKKMQRMSLPRNFQMGSCTFYYYYLLFSGGTTAHNQINIHGRSKTKISCNNQGKRI